MMAFDVRTQVHANCIIVTLAGFATLDDVARFEEALRAAIADLPKDRGPHRLLYDVSAATIQSQDVVAALRKLALASPRTSAFALVNSSALAGRQLARIFSGIDVHLAADREAALAWLRRQ